MDRLDNSPYKLVIFDMDQTLFDETLYFGVKDILSNLKDENCKMAIASYNPCAEWLCDRYDITQYFDIICGYHSPIGKITHISEIFKFYLKKNIPVLENNTFFYDDDQSNINEISRITKINCIKVPNGGIKKSHIFTNLTLAE